MRPGREWDPRSPMNLWHIFLPLWVQDNLLYFLSLTSLGSMWPLSCCGLLKGGLGMGTAGMETVNEKTKNVLPVCAVQIGEVVWKMEEANFQSLWNHTLWILHSCRTGKPWRTLLPASSYHLPSPFRSQWGLELLKPEKFSITSPWLLFVFSRKEKMIVSNASTNKTQFDENIWGNKDEFGAKYYSGSLKWNH